MTRASYLLNLLEKDDAQIAGTITDEEIEALATQLTEGGVITDETVKHLQSLQTKMRGAATYTGTMYRILKVVPAQMVRALRNKTFKSFDRRKESKIESWAATLSGLQEFANFELSCLMCIVLKANVRYYDQIFFNNPRVAKILALHSQYDPDARLRSGTTAALINRIRSFVGYHEVMVRTSPSRRYELCKNVAYVYFSNLVQTLTGNDGGNYGDKVEAALRPRLSPQVDAKLGEALAKNQESLFENIVFECDSRGRLSPSRDLTLRL